MGRASRSAGTHTQCSSAPTSMPAAWGWMIGMFSGAGVCFLPFFAIGSSSLGSRGESKILLRKDTLGGGALRGARLFHLDGTSAERWRDANKARRAGGDIDGPYHTPPFPNPDADLADDGAPLSLLR